MDPDSAEALYDAFRAFDAMDLRWTLPCDRNGATAKPKSITASRAQRVSPTDAVAAAIATMSDTHTTWAGNAVAQYTWIRLGEEYQ